jgi:hypothetical protein
MWKVKITVYFKGDTVPAVLPYGVIPENVFLFFSYTIGKIM